MKKSLLFMAMLLILAVALTAVDVTIGAGTSVNTSTGYPAPYGNYYKNSRTQYIYTVAEFNAAGGGAGNITAIGLNNSILNGCAARPMIIKMGHTALSTLTTTFVTGLTEVYNVASYTPVVGWNTHTLTTPFNWDGTSNVVVEVFYGNIAQAYTSNAGTYYHSAANTALWYRSDSVNAWTVTAGTLSPNRANMLFNMQPFATIDPPNPAVVVSPADGALGVLPGATLNWGSGGGAPTDYDLYFGTSNPPPFIGNFTTTSYNPGGMPLSTEHWWQVVPHNANGYAAGCPVWSFTTSGPTVYMTNGSQAVAAGETWSFYDSGGPDATYQISENYTFTFTPGVGYLINVDFQSFYTESGYDFLRIYDGPDATAPLLGTFQGTTIPGPFTSTHPSGALTFNFTSDGSVQYDGWFALVSAVPVPVDPVFSYTPAALNFGSVMEGGSSAWQNVTVSNLGGGTLEFDVADMSTSGPDVDQFLLDGTNLPAYLGTGESVLIPVQFNPTSQGAKSATLTLEYDGMFYDVALAGTGMPAGTVVIGDGTTDMQIPIYPYYGYTLSQTIYPQTLINTADSRVESISYWYNGALEGVVSNQWTIWMGHTADETFATTTSWVPFSGMQQVFQGEVALPATSGWVTIPLTTPFNYNNVDNLVVGVHETEPGYEANSSPYFYSTNTGANNSLLAYNDGAAYNPAAPPVGQFRTGRPNTMFILGDVPIGTPGHVTLTSPANDATMIDPSNTILSWTADPATAPPAYYQIFVGADPIDPASEYWGEFYYETSGRASFDLSAEADIELTYLSRWYWAVLPVGDDDSTPDPLDPEFMVYNFRIQPPPAEIAVLPVSMTSTVDFGDTDVQTLTITNDGGLPLNFSIGLVDDDTRASQIVPFDPANQRVPNPNAAQFAETTTFIGPITEAASRAIFDVQFNYPTFDNNGEYGIGYDGTYIYVSDWNSFEIRKYDTSGNFIEIVPIGLTVGIRDLAYDGQYFYGSPANTTIYQMDFTNGVIVGTFTSPVATRGIAYDPDTDTFWVGNAWTTDMRRIDRTGAQVQALTLAEGSCSGLAYDNLSGPTPTLWGYTQSGVAANRLVQFDITSGAVLQSYDLNDSGINLGASSSGGFEIVTGLVPGFATLLGNIQNVSFWGLELCATANWASADPASGTVPAGESLEIDITFNGIDNSPGEYSGHLAISNNAGPVVEVPLDFTVIGDWLPVLSINPTTWNYNDVEQLNPSVKQFTITNTGGPTLDIADGGIYLSGDAEGNFALNAAGLPVALGNGESYNFTVTFTPLTTGAKSATINIMDNRTLTTVPLSGNGIEEPIGTIVDLAATVIGNEDVDLDWLLVYGGGGEPGWIHYDDGTNVDGIGTGGSATFDVAVKFTADQLNAYGGMYLTSINFFPKSANTEYTLKVWTGGTGLTPTTLVHTQAVTPIIEQWNEVALTTPILITGSEAIWFGYNCNVLVVDAGTDMYYPAGCDAGPAVAGLGDLIELGGTWYSMNNQWGLNYNWNLQGYVDEMLLAPGKTPQMLNIPVATLPTRSVDLRNVTLSTQSGTTSQRVLRGYNVYRNGSMINGALVNTNSYTDVNPGIGTWTYTVEAVYYTQNSAMSNPAEATITPPVPTNLPFTEAWDSGDFATNQWVATGTNWSVNVGVGNPLPAAQFSWNPQVTMYELPLTSYWLNGVGVANIGLSYDLGLNNYSFAAENFMTVQVWNEDTRSWNTVATHTSLDYPDFNTDVWGTFSVDITPYAANQTFKIRFLANGEDSYEINQWYVDNIVVQETAATLDAPENVVLSPDPADPEWVFIEWDAVAGATWYAVYYAVDPFGTYELLGVTGDTSGWINIVGNYEFYKVTAGAGATPTTRGRIYPARRNK